MSEQKTTDSPILKFIAWTALDTVGFYLIWRYVAVPVFDAPAMMLGHWFAVVLGFRILAARVTDRLDELAGLLEEIRDIQLFAEQNSAHKFDQLGKFIQKYADPISRVIGTAKHEQDKGAD